MSKYFGRQYLIDIGSGEKIIDSRESDHPLQIEFAIDTSFGNAMSTMELSIINLSKDSIGKIKQGQTIVLQAGYPDIFGPIFTGRIINFQSPQDGTERRTTLFCWSGLEELRGALCTVSHGEDTRIFDIIEQIAFEVFDKPPVFVGFDEAYKAVLGAAIGGYSEQESHKSLLDKLAKNYKFQWLIENERCLLMQLGSNRGGEPYDVNAKTGLVGGVSVTWLGADFEMKLNPNIQIGDRVKIQSRATTIGFSKVYNMALKEDKTTIGDGVYVVKALRRKGNYYGQNSWSSELTCWREGEKGLPQNRIEPQ